MAMTPNDQDKLKGLDRASMVERAQPALDAGEEWDSPALRDVVEADLRAEGLADIRIRRNGVEYNALEYALDDLQSYAPADDSPPPKPPFGPEEPNADPAE